MYLKWLFRSLVMIKCDILFLCGNQVRIEFQNFKTRRNQSHYIVDLRVSKVYVKSWAGPQIHLQHIVLHKWAREQKDLEPLFFMYTFILRDILNYSWNNSYLFGIFLKNKYSEKSRTNFLKGILPILRRNNSPLKKI